MPEFKIPVYWQMGGEIVVEAPNLVDAVHRANDMVGEGTFGLTDIHNQNYVEGTITVDEEGAIIRN